MNNYSETSIIPNELRVIHKTLNEIKYLNDEPSLLEITENLLARSRKIFSSLNLSVHTVNFSNYLKTSHTLLLGEEAVEPQLSRLTEALSDLRAKRLIPWNFESLLQLNSKVLGNSRSSIRHLETDPDYPFPSPSLIHKGMSLLYEAFPQGNTNSMLSTVAFCQALLSLHPFEDGNHRTTRLIMDFLLTEQGLPPVTVESGYDLLMANPTSGQIFKLESAIQKVIYGINNTLTKLEN